MTCAKQTVTATIKNNGKTWVKSNSCDNPRDICPREGLKTGEGYHLCKEICGQQHHAEVAVCFAAGEDAKGGTLFVEGHTYCCDACKKVMKQYGIKGVVFR